MTQPTIRPSTARENRAVGAEDHKVTITCRKIERFKLMTAMGSLYVQTASNAPASLTNRARARPLTAVRARHVQNIICTRRESHELMEDNQMEGTYQVLLVGRSTGIQVLTHNTRKIGGPGTRLYDQVRIWQGHRVGIHTCIGTGIPVQ